MNADTPTLAASVVVPSYNSSRTIRDALRSLLAQDIGRPFEVIVVDSSTDGTDVIVREEFPGVTLVRRETKTPPGAARNLGVRHAHAPVIAFLDADCVAAASWLRRHVEAHAANAAGVGGSVANGNPRSLIGWASFLIEFSRLAPSAPRRAAGDVVTCNCSYKRRVFERYGGFHEGDFFAEDMLFSQRLVAAGERLRFEPLAVALHQNRERLSDFLRHMRALGEGVGMARLHAGAAHPLLARRAWAGAAALPLRVGRIVWRAARWHPRDAWRLPALLPLIAAGFVAFTLGELGASKGSTIAADAKNALAASPTVRPGSEA